MTKQEFNPVQLLFTTLGSGLKIAFGITVVMQLNEILNLLYKIELHLWNLRGGR